ncbi:Hypothetical protein Cul210932_2326 [Corynebacterium ulcerans]|nr:Hypothetical protein Cul210932_2326 [Corynebacterium ulcerans]ALD96027.1 Hypothetical protein Cul131001_2362 [Corynebacterium ulcerans]
MSDYAFGYRDLGKKIQLYFPGGGKMADELAGSILVMQEEDT